MGRPRDLKADSWEEAGRKASRYIESGYKPKIDEVEAIRSTLFGGYA
ncbi:MAG: hypothetical protein WC941_01825 [Candidatus Bathyarchaeia archaeon]